MLKMKMYVCATEGEPIDCPSCGSPAVYTDNGIQCSNPGCKHG